MTFFKNIKFGNFFGILMIVLIMGSLTGGLWVIQNKLNSATKTFEGINISKLDSIEGVEYVLKSKVNDFCGTISFIENGKNVRSFFVCPAKLTEKQIAELSNKHELPLLKRGENFQYGEFTGYSESEDVDMVLFQKIMSVIENQ